MIRDDDGRKKSTVSATEPSGVSGRAYCSGCARRFGLSTEMAAEDLRTIAPLVHLIRPYLHHLATFGPKLSGVRVRAADGVCFLMGELPLDRVRIPTTHFIEPDSSSRSKAVYRSFLLGIAKSTQSSIEGVL